MALLKRITEHIAGQTNLDKNGREALFYGLQVFCLNVSGLLAVLAVSWALNCLPEAVMVAVIVALLRSLAGGAHCTTPARCTVATALIFPLLGKTAVFLQTLAQLNLAPYIILVYISSLTVIFLKAPVDSPAKPINTAKHRLRLRVLSLAAVTALTIVQLILLQYQSGISQKVIVAVGLGILWATFILTCIGHKFMALLDNLLRNPFAEEVNGNA